MRNQFIIIWGVLIWQGGIFDFAGWYGIFKEKTGHKLEWLYRLIKELHDIPLTIGILWYLGVSFDVIGVIMLLKWSGWGDAFYIAAWKLFNRKRVYFEEGKEVWWMWWTPVGMVRSEIVYRRTDPLPAKAGLPLSGGDVIFYRLFGNWYLKKGIVTKTEFYLQLTIATFVGQVVLSFELVSKLINWIF